MAQALAPTGALMTFIALWTGAFWGRPTWGTYWAWDARMTSELILLFLYFGVHRAAQRDRRSAARRRACAVLALVGVVNVPIIYFSVQWWNTLHQGSSVSLTAAPSMAAIMLTGMLVMALAAGSTRSRRRCARAHDHPRARAGRRLGRGNLRRRRGSSELGELGRVLCDGRLRLLRLELVRRWRVAGPCDSRSGAAVAPPRRGAGSAARAAGRAHGARR